jgi:exodeoxyribonuclease VII small subunit
LLPLSPTPEASTGSGAAQASTFETAFVELQRVVQQLEDGGLDLAQAVQLFERGSQLAQTCEQLVEQAELRVTRLTAESASPLSVAADASAEA